MVSFQKRRHFLLWSDGQTPSYISGTTLTLKAAMDASSDVSHRTTKNNAI